MATAKLKKRQNQAILICILHIEMDCQSSLIQTWNNPSCAAVGVAESFLIVVADGHAIIMFIGMYELEVACGGVIRKRFHMGRNHLFTRGEITIGM